MATRLGATVQEERRVMTSVEQTRAHFSNLDHIAAATIEANRVQREADDTLFFELPEQKHGPVTFKPRYRVRYTQCEGRLTWASCGEGNMYSRGQATFEETPDGGTKIVFEQEIALELSVNRMLGKMLRPLFQQLMAPGVRAYLDRMVSGLS
jgi:hypothetical protein